MIIVCSEERKKELDSDDDLEFWSDFLEEEPNFFDPKEID